MHFSTVLVMDHVENVKDALSQAGRMMCPFQEGLEIDSYFSAVPHDHLETAMREYSEAEGDSDPEPETDTEEHIAWVTRAVGWGQTWDPTEGVHKDGEFGIMITHNPEAKWDNWTMGGRWGGWFPVKDGVHFSEHFLGNPESFSKPMERVGYADLIQVKNFDRHRKIREAESKASAEYENFLRATCGMDYGVSYEEIAENHYGKTGIDIFKDFSEASNAVRLAVRQEYFSQEFALFNNNIMVRDDPHDYWCINTGGQSEYVRKRLDKTTVPYSFLIDGDWKERPSEESLREEWAQKADEIFTSLNPESWVMMVDCHI